MSNDKAEATGYNPDEYALAQPVKKTSPARQALFGLSLVLLVILAFLGLVIVVNALFGAS